MKKTKYLKPLVLSIITSTFIACGGGSSSSDDTSANTNPPAANTSDTEAQVPVNEKPIANAGIDQNITFGNQVILNAELSSDDGEIISYEWSLDGKKLSDEKSFVMEVFPKEGSYKFDLKVTDDKGDSSTDSLMVLTFSDTVVALKTNQGTISLKMKSSIAPKAVENFVTHSKNGYYDGLTFHRVIKDFMIQGGDPTGTGRGGESIWGTAFEDEFDSSVRFDKPYLLAMANRGPNTNGSQFFITLDKAEHLNDKHTIFGEVVDGKEVVDRIEIFGKANSKIEKSTVIFEVPKG